MSENGQKPTGGESKPSGKPDVPAHYHGKRPTGGEAPDRLKPFLFAPGEDPRRVNATAVQRRKADDKRLRVAIEMEERVEAEVDLILRPYFSALKLTPEESWSPRTKLDFYQSQTSVAEKLLNRVEGMPVQRQHQIDGNGEDVALPQIDAMPTPLVERLLIALASGKAEAPADVVDAEVVPEVPDSESS